MTRHYDLTLDGTAQSLSAVLAAGEDDHPLLRVYLEGDDGNSNPIFVGADNTVSATSYGTRLPAPAAAEPLTERRDFTGVKLHLSDFWVLGTDTEVLHIFVVRQ
jgi:hypothetical protein